MDAFWPCQPEAEGVCCGHALAEKETNACAGEHHVQTDVGVEEDSHQQRTKRSQHQRREWIAWPKTEGHQPLESTVTSQREQSSIAG
jgi:hypothetical protein